MATESAVHNAAIKASRSRSITAGAAVDMLPRALADLNLQSTPLPAQLGTVKIPASGCDTSGGTDSGYASQAPTPERLTPESSQGSFPPEVALPSRKLFPRKVTSLKPFNQAIPEATQHRFYDLKELFDKPLYRYLTLARPEVQLNSISIKLMVLGESEASAKPWVVVLCDAKIKRNVEKYFNQRVVRQQFRSGDLDSDLPSLDLVVCNRPPRPIAATQSGDIYGDSGDDASFVTLCGTIIKVSSPDETRIARIGGVVEVTSLVGVSKLYAMTAGHIIDQDQARDDKSDLDSLSDEDEPGYRSESEDEEGLFINGDEEFTIDLAGEDTCESQEDALPSTKSCVMGQAEPPSVSWSKMGHIFVSSHYNRDDKPNLDWALIELDDRSRYRPNLLFTPDADEPIDLVDTNRRSKLQSRGIVKERVVVLKNTGVWERGTLSTSASFLLLAPGKRLIETHILTMDDGSELIDGDCGSWVVHHATGLVYGHVVASDVFRDAYVVPLDATFRDIETKLIARRVSLPTRTQVGELLANWRPDLHKQDFVDSGYSTMYSSPTASANASPTPSNNSSPAQSPPSPRQGNRLSFRVSDSGPARRSPLTPPSRPPQSRPI